MVGSVVLGDVLELVNPELDPAQGLRANAAEKRRIVPTKVGAFIPKPPSARRPAQGIIIADMVIGLLESRLPSLVALVVVVKRHERVARHHDRLTPGWWRCDCGGNWFGHYFGCVKLG